MDIYITITVNVVIYFILQVLLNKVKPKNDKQNTSLALKLNPWQ